jgi:hypothetical protein
LEGKRGNRSAPHLWAADDKNLTGFYSLRGVLQLEEKGPIRFNLVVWHSHQDETHVDISQELLPFDISIDGHENIKLALRQIKERLILASAHSGLRHGFHEMARKGLFYSGVDALV